MAQVSRLPLPKALEEQMYTLLFRVLADLRNESQVAEFLDDLLTPTEKVMLGKRLAIAVLLSKGIDQRTIHTIMKVSTTTVHTVNFWLKQKGNGYRRIIDKLKKDEQWVATMEKIDNVLRQLFPHSRSMSRVLTPIPKEEFPRDKLY